MDSLCPDCGSPLYLDPDAWTLQAYVLRGFAVRGQPLPVRKRLCIVAACSGCEFTIELKGLQ